MKKSLCIGLIAMLLLGMFGCAKRNDEKKDGSQETVLQNNSVFTDDFFADIVEIADSANGRVQGEQMKPVIEYLKGLKLAETEEHLETTNEAGEQLYGFQSINFYKADGTEIAFIRNNQIFSGFDANGEKISYVIQEGNLNSGLSDAFAK